MTTHTNHAAWLMSKQDAKLVVGEAPYHPPGPNEVVIKTHVVAMNPADVIIQKLGILIKNYPAILGCDVAGVVVEVGSEINKEKDIFEVGDRVFGSSTPLVGDYQYSGFQEYVVLRMPRIAKIPDGISFVDAVVLPLGISTASSCLFQEGLLGLDFPYISDTQGEDKKKGTLLVWGASSSVGSCGVQLATLAGYEVIGIASKKNHEFVKSIGAVQVFDQADPNLIGDLVAALKGKIVVGAYDAVAGKGNFDVLCEVLSKSDGKKFIASVIPGSENMATHGVTVKSNFSHTETPVAPHIWGVFLEPALASGKLQCKPPAEVVGHGLGEIQKGLDLLAQGVSAKKIVLTL